MKGVCDDEKGRLFTLRGGGSRFFWRKPRKTPKLPRIFCACRTLENPGKEGENLRKTKETPESEKAKEIKKKQGTEGQGKDSFETLLRFPGQRIPETLVNGSSGRKARASGCLSLLDPSPQSVQPCRS